MVLALIVSHSFTLQMFFSQIKSPNSHQKKKKKKNQKPLEKIYEMTNLKECCIKYDLFNGPLFTFD